MFGCFKDSCSKLITLNDHHYFSIVRSLCASVHLRVRNPCEFYAEANMILSHIKMHIISLLWAYLNV